MREIVVSACATVEGDEYACCPFFSDEFSVCWHPDASKARRETYLDLDESCTLPGDCPLRASLVQVRIP